MSPRVELSCLAALALVACGGSSSETPPPLEPLPANLHYDRSATALAGDQGETRTQPDGGLEADEPADPASPRRSGVPGAGTWGAEREPELK